MTTVSNRSSINRKTLSGIIELNADALDTDTAQIGDILIQNDTLSGVDTIYFEDGVHNASIGLDNNGDLLVDGTGELRITTDGVNMEGETLNMNSGEIHNVPLIHSKNNEDITIEGKGSGDIILKTANTNRLVVLDSGVVQVNNGLSVTGQATFGNILSSGIGTYAGVYGTTLQATTATFGSAYTTTLGATIGSFSGLSSTTLQATTATFTTANSYAVVANQGFFDRLSGSTLSVSGASTMGNIYSSGVGTFASVRSTSLTVFQNSTMGNIYSSGIGTFSGCYSTTLEASTATFGVANATTMSASTATFGSVNSTTFSASNATFGSVNATTMSASNATFGSVNATTMSASNATLGQTNFTNNVYLSDKELRLRSPVDANHALRYCGGTTPFASQNLDGSVLYGYGGGALGSTNGGQRIALQWNNVNQVSIVGTLNLGKGIKFTNPLFLPVLVGNSQAQFNVFSGRRDPCSSFSVSLPVYNAGGFIMISYWNGVGNWASATGVCRSGNSPVLQTNGSNPAISGYWNGSSSGILFSGSALNNTGYVCIAMISDGQFDIF